MSQNIKWLKTDEVLLVVCRLNVRKDIFGARGLVNASPIEI